jgi:hypothetical protein
MRSLVDPLSYAGERHLIILKYVNQVPSFASCSNCQQKFFAPSGDSDRTGAQVYLEEKFFFHKCSVAR